MRPVDLYITDIANPGFGPIFAVHARGEDGQTYVFTDNRVLSREFGDAQRFLNKVRAKDEFNPELWDRATMTDAEREAYLAPGGYGWQWEEMEKQNGNW